MKSGDPLGNGRVGDESERGRARAPSGERGLSGTEARGLLDIHGPNRLPGGRRSPFAALFLFRLGSAPVFALLGAGAVLALFGDALACAVSLVAVVAFAAAGAVGDSSQEFAARPFVEFEPTHAEVRRAGKEARVPAESVVPGDALLLRKGDIACADAVVRESDGFMADDSALTGHRPRGGRPIGTAERVLMGSEVTAGFAVAIVEATGERTRLGRVARAAVDAVKPKAPSRAWVDGALAVVSVLGAGAAALACVAALAVGRGAEAAFVGAATAIAAAIPSAAPLVSMIAMRAAKARMAASGAKCMRAAAVGSLGAASAAVVDKAGVLTQERMAVRHVWTRNAALLHACMLRCNDARLVRQGEAAEADAAEGDAAMSGTAEAGVGSGATRGDGATGSPMKSSASGSGGDLAAKPGKAAGGSVGVETGPGGLAGGDAAGMASLASDALTSAEAEAGEASARSPGVPIGAGARPARKPGAGVGAGATYQGRADDVALLEYIAMRGDAAPKYVGKQTRVAAIPYDTDRRISTVAVRITPEDGGQDGTRVYVKGDFDAVVARCTHVIGAGGAEQLSIDSQKVIAERSGAILAAAQQVIAFAYRDYADRWYESFSEIPEPEAGLVFIGIVGLANPAREDTRSSVAHAMREGVSLYMTSCDDERAALTAAEEYGLVAVAQGAGGSSGANTPIYPDAPVSAPALSPSALPDGTQAASDVDAILHQSISVAADAIPLQSASSAAGSQPAAAHAPRAPQSITASAFAALDEAGREEACRRASVFAEAEPEQRALAVEALKGLGERVAVTGAGALDVAAMRMADAAVCAWDAPLRVVAAADATLSDGSLANLVSAMAEARRSVAGELVAFRHLLSCAAGTAAVALIAAFAGWPLLTPGRALALNVAVYGLTGLALAILPCTASLFGDALLVPVKLGAVALSRGSVIQAAIQGGVMAAAACAAYALWGKGPRGGDAAFCALAACAILFALLAWLRNLKRSGIEREQERKGAR